MRAEALTAALLVLAGAAGAQPMSAIDWLTDSVAAPSDVVVSGQPDTVTGTTNEAIRVQPIGAQSIDGLGLTDPATLGLPRELWGASDATTLTRLMDTVEPRTPTLRTLLVDLLTARSDGPASAEDDGAFYLARIDRLLELGALDRAEALVLQGDLDDPALFRRWFDIRLLLGTEDAACARLDNSPTLSPTYPARIFCLARGGDWNAAALTLDNAEALGELSPEDDALLLRFLDESTAEENGPLPDHQVVTPLIFRLREAVGESIPTDTLPRAFAHADLRPQNGWKAQLDAAERLARVGAIPPHRLFSLYRLRAPAASGGVWDRAAAIQSLEAGLARVGDGLGLSVNEAWRVMNAADLTAPFTRHYGPRLLRLVPDGPGREVALTAAMMSADVESAARAVGDKTPELVFPAALVTDPKARAASSDTRQGLIQQGFGSDALPSPLETMLAERRIGEAALVAIDLFATGAAGDAQDLVLSIRLMRAIGLESVARHAALEYLLLDSRT